MVYTSEKYYYNQDETYYFNIRALGLEYPDLDYIKAVPFLLMLISSWGKLKANYKLKHLFNKSEILLRKNKWE